MCPLWPLHLIVLYLLALFPLWIICQQIPQLTTSSIAAYFLPDEIQLDMLDSAYVNVTLNGTGLRAGDELTLLTGQSHIATSEWKSTHLLTEADENNNRWQGVIRVNGSFLGSTTVRVAKKGDEERPFNGSLPVTVTRPERVIDRVFVASVATFVSLIFINFGCAMHWPTVKDVIRRPIGPIIGMVGQFLFMPLISFGLGFLIFPNEPKMRLGMFFTGVSPGGGASNIWTFILGGNLNLSLAMTTISTLAAFALMPAWLFSLGQVIFRDANIGVPYDRIATFVVGLIVPLLIGLGMQRWTPKLAAFMVRILKGFSTLLLIFIIVFAIITNLYIFELFSWQIIVAGMGLPWLGYMAGYALAWVFRQPHADALAISIETGIQNTGIAIFLLRYALGQPAADLATVIPVSVAIMTPIPMTAIYIYQKVRGCISNRNQHKKIVEEDNSPVSEPPRAHRLSASVDDK